MAARRGRLSVRDCDPDRDYVSSDVISDVTRTVDDRGISDHGNRRRRRSILQRDDIVQAEDRLQAMRNERRAPVS